MLVCLNGTFIPHEEAQLSINDGGFLFGDTLFETIKARKKNILLQNEHLNRLEIAAKLLNFPYDRKRIEVSLQQLAKALAAPTTRIRLTLSRGSYQGILFPDSADSLYLVTASALNEVSDEERKIGATCVIAPNQRVNPLSHLPQMKRGNYVDCLYAANYARSQTAREALFVDAEGHLLEGSTSNLFAFIAGCLITPQIGQNILAGIMRRQVINAATEMGIPVNERNLHKDELCDAEEAFICNSLVDILPISSLNRQPVNRGESWKTLQKTLRMRIET